MKTVVIVGGGFAGLNAAKKLANKKDISVILVDKKNHHLFQPLLYQVATAGLSPGDIAIPIRSQFSGVPNIEVHWGKVSGIDLEKKVVELEVSKQNFNYDYLVLACGAVHSYFAHPRVGRVSAGT